MKWRTEIATRNAVFLLIRGFRTLGSGLLGILRAKLFMINVQLTKLQRMTNKVAEFRENSLFTGRI